MKFGTELHWYNNTFMDHSYQYRYIVESDCVPVLILGLGMTIYVQYHA